MAVRSRRGLYFALLTVGALLVSGTFTAARADLALSAKFDNVSNQKVLSFSTNSGGTWDSGLAGRYRWTQGAGDGIKVVGTAFTSFCIELGQHIAVGQTYNYMVTPDIPNLPQTTMGAGMGIDKAKQLGTLAQGIGSGLINAGYAEIQAAIWNIVYENTTGNFDTNTGTFQLTAGTSSSALAFNERVNDLLEYVAGKDWWNFNALTASHTVIGLTSNTAQDQVVIVSQAQYLQAVPAPAGLVMAGMGCMILCGYHYLRRRKPASVASVV